MPRFDAVRPEWEAMARTPASGFAYRLANGRSICGIGRGVAADGALGFSPAGGGVGPSGRIVSARLA